MKKILILLIIFLVSVNSFADSWLLKVEGKEFSYNDFINDFKIYLKLNNQGKNISKYIKDKKFILKYFYANYLVKKILLKYAKENYVKRRPKLKSALSKLLYKNAIAKFVQYYHVSRFMKEPTDAQLKKMHKVMLKRGMIKPRFRNKPFKQMKRTIARVYLHRQNQFLLAKFINSVQGSNRIIYNDDLEQNLIDKYTKDTYTLSQMSNAKNRYWLIKFNNQIINMYQAETDIIRYLTVNAAKKQVNKYNNNKSYRIKMRKTLFRQLTDIYFLYFFAKNKGYLTSSRYKKNINFVYQTLYLQSFVAITFRPKAKQPTMAQIRKFYNSYKKTRFKKVTLKQAKGHIINRLKFIQLQRYQNNLFQRLKNRYKFKINTKLLK